MKDFLNGIVRAGFEQWLGFLLFCFLLSLLIILLTAVSSDHEIRCYYMRADSMSSVVSYKVMGDIDWGEDVAVFIGNHPSDSKIILSDLKQCAAK